MTETHHRGPNAPAYDIAAKILLIGEAGVGKTHLILRYGNILHFLVKCINFLKTKKSRQYVRAATGQVYGPAGCKIQRYNRSR